MCTIYRLKILLLNKVAVSFPYITYFQYISTVSLPGFLFRPHFYPGTQSSAPETFGSTIASVLTKVTVSNDSHIYTTAESPYND